MMETPFFWSRNQTSTPPPYQRRTPVHMRSFPTQTPPSSWPGKVVSIPVRFVESEEKRSESALKIQKTFRGFRFRKTVKKILELKREVDGVEKKLQEREVMAVIRRDVMERLKVNETLMALLFKLDSIRGFDDGVRDFRKAVIRKAISLQELIDSAIDDDHDNSKLEERDSEEIVNEVGDNLREDCGILENPERFHENADNVSEFLDDSSKRAVNSVDIAGETLEISAGNEEDVDNVRGNLDDRGKLQVENSEKTTEEIEKTINCEEFADETLEKDEVIVDDEGANVGNAMQVESLAAGGDSWECVGDEAEEHKSNVVEAGQKDDHGGGAEDHEGGKNSAKESSNDEWYVVGGVDVGEVREKRVKLLEKMAEDNQRLMAMVADLCQKNAIQTHMICSLSQRVEHLEKAMGLRKKKKKCNATHI